MRHVRANITAITAQDSPKVTHWCEGWARDHWCSRCWTWTWPGQVALLAHDTLWSANEPKTAGPEYVPSYLFPAAFFLSIVASFSLLLGNCRVNFGLDFRLCQILNIDYLETYSAISKSTRLRLVWHKLHVHLPHGNCLRVSSSARASSSAPASS